MARGRASSFRTRLLFVAAGLGIAAAIWGGYVAFRAARALETARREAAEQSEIRYTISRLARNSSVFEPISSPAIFHDAVVLNGSLYACGPAGLTEFGEDGTPRARYLAGPDLPAAVTAVAAGVLADAGEPELLVATLGAGLIAFNGRSFRQIRPEPASYADLTAVLPLSTGRVLLGTEKHGVLVYDGKRITAFHSALSGQHITALAGDEASVWAGTTNDGVLHWHAGAVDRFGESGGLPDARVLSIAVERDSAYIGTPAGVAEFSGSSFVRVIAPGAFAQSLLVRSGKLMIGTLEQGVIEAALAPERGHLRERRGEPLAAAVYRFIENGGTVYAVADDGVYRIEERRGSWERVAAPGTAALTDRNISALAFDPAGRLWTGYFDRGLDILDADLTHATHIENDRVFCINRIVPDPARGVTAVATANGLVLFDSAGRPRQVLGRGEGLIADHVTDVIVRQNGMTVATPAGLTFLDGSGARSLYAFHGLVNNHAYTLAEAHGRLLVGTLGGLSVLEGDTVRTSYTASNSGLKHNWVTAVVPVGDDWFVGTYGAGVLKLDSAGAWHTFEDLRAPFEVNPNAMLVTDGAVYAGSLSSGIFIYDRAAGRWHNVRAGLPSANVTAFAARGGFIYAGTDNGLVRFPENFR